MHDMKHSRNLIKRKPLSRKPAMTEVAGLSDSQVCARATKAVIISGRLRRIPSRG